MPRKIFTAGEVLAAADVNTFLMDQSVMTFADSAARGSAIGTATEGMVTYLEDTDGLELWNGTAWVSATPASGGGAATTNAIINGAFEINQRAFSSSTAAGFGFDRWNNSLAGDGTVTFSSQAFTPGSAPEAYVEGTTHLRIVTTGQTGTNPFARFEQPIEDARTFAGQNVTFSFWAKAASGTPKIAIELFRSYGTGGSPSTADNLTVGQIELTGGTAWTKYSITYAMPSLSGKTFGTTPNTSFVTVRFFVSAGSDFNARTGSMGIQSNTFDIWGVQVEAGSTATAFRRNANSLQGELAACQRYYQKSYNQAIAPGASESSIIVAVQGNIANNAFYHREQLLVTMRAAPTIRFWSLSSALTRSTNAAGGDYGANSAVGANIRDNGFNIKNESGTTLTVIDGLIITNYDASSEL